MTEPLLELRGISKRRSSFQLDPVDLALPGGLTMGLIGTNGAGKTTLLKLILGLIQPDAGQLLFKGRDLASAGPELRRRIAYVPDEPRFVPELRLRSLKDAHARFHREWNETRWTGLMAAFELDPAARAHTLSRGMRTKFALTLALAREADLLVLDEPTTGLDPVFRSALLSRLASLIQDDGRALLFSTHITSDLEDRVDLVTLMQAGRKVFTLDQETLREQWVLVKGGLDLLDAETRAGFQGLRTTPYGFEALSRDGASTRARFAGSALVERASLEDIIVFTGRSQTHVA